MISGDVAWFEQKIEWAIPWEVTGWRVSYLGMNSARKNENKESSADSDAEEAEVAEKF